MTCLTVVCAYIMLKCSFDVFAQNCQYYVLHLSIDVIAIYCVEAVKWSGTLFCTFCWCIPVSDLHVDRTSFKYNYSNVFYFES